MATATTTSSVRQSSRQTRTNPARNSKTVGSSLRQNSLLSNGGISTPAAASAPQEPHGFYPAITHFTDTVTALPREYRRHWSLLKEVDAKIWAPEETLHQLVEQCNASKPANPNAYPTNSSLSGPTNDTNRAIEIEARTLINTATDNARLDHQQAVQAQRELQRRHLFHGLRMTLLGIIPTLDEKNHVIDNANDDIDRQIQRLETVFPYIEHEVSDEARNGSRIHWAYSNSKANAKATEGRSRKEAAAGLAIMADPDISARSESRRLAMLANKKRGQQHAESELEDAGPSTSSRKTQGLPKVRRLGEVAAESGLGITAPAGTGASKRKKTEKGPTSAGGITMERSLSGPSKGSVAMSREPSQQDSGKKRKAANAASTARKRINANASPTNSPNLASSPVVGSISKDTHRDSPAPSTSHRPQSSRARQNSTQNTDKRPSSSAATIKSNTNGTTNLSVSTPELHKVAVMTGKSTAEVKSTMKETTTSTGDKLVEMDGPVTEPTANGETAPQGGILLERSNSKSAPEKLKREATADNDPSRPSSSRASPRQPASATFANSTPSEPPPAPRPERSARARSSKTSTPVVSTFAESGTTGRAVSTRPSRTNSTTAASSSANTDNSASNSNPIPLLPPKRSHKKGAGLAAQAAALAAAQLKEKERERKKNGSNGEGGSAGGGGGGGGIGGGGGGGGGVEVEEIDDESGGDEPRYCYCNGISYGEMVACDNKDCAKEWFHLSCVGLDKAPGKNAKWYCNECKKGVKEKDKDKDKDKDSKSSSTGGNGSGNGSSGGNGNGKGK